MERSTTTNGDGLLTALERLPLGDLLRLLLALPLYSL